MILRGCHVHKKTSFSGSKGDHLDVTTFIAQLKPLSDGMNYQIEYKELYGNEQITTNLISMDSFI